ncbi:MAG: hypothetical protein AAFZ07_26400 [Actinomycetota bacterium]
MGGLDTGATSPVVGQPPWWLQVPGALWLYALLRSLAFAAPAWSSGGRIGLGAIVAGALFVAILRRSRRAWTVLVWLDVVSLVMLIAVWSSADGAALAAPALAGIAMVTLWAPSVRRHVGAVDH